MVIYSESTLNVLMVHEDPCIRVVKQVEALTKLGVCVDLLCKRIESHPGIQKFVRTIYNYKDYFDLRGFLEANQEVWDVIHAHNEPNCLIAVTIAACSKRPVVYDCHDMTSARSRIHGVEADIERYCFENCAAVVHVSSGIKDIAFKKYGPKLSIVMPSFPVITLQNFPPKKKLEGIHVVYQGGVVDSTNTKYSYRYYLPMFERLCEEGINVHIFPAPTIQRGAFHGYLALHKKNNFFHIHESLPYGRLIEEMGQFQWGFTGFNFDYISEELTREFLNSALPNKFFDYLIAGVTPVVINNATAAKWAVEHRVGYCADNIDDFIRIVTASPVLDPLSSLAGIDMGVQIKKLIALYRELQKQDRRATPKPPFFTVLKERGLDGSGTVSFLSQQTAPVLGSLEMLSQYYKSGVWLYKEKNVYYSHTSADSHAFFLSAFCSLYKCGRKESLDDIKFLVSLLFALNNDSSGGAYGWGLGAPYENKIRSKELPPAVCPASTTYTYTSSVVCSALLDAYSILHDESLLEACNRWRVSFLKNIGFHVENRCCLYADHVSWRLPQPLFVPNVTPLFLGFLARLGEASGDGKDALLIQRVANSFWQLRTGYNWEYSSGQKEDLLHLGMILEGLLGVESFLTSERNLSGLVSEVIAALFSRHLQVSTDSHCFGVSNWGPGWALFSLLLSDTPQEYIAAGTEFLVRNPQVMFYNVRTASIYARFFGKLLERLVEKNTP